VAAISLEYLTAFVGIRTAQEKRLLHHVRGHDPGSVLNAEQPANTVNIPHRFTISYDVDMGNRQQDGSSDRRWIVLAEDGRYVTLGRATDPATSELDGAEASMKSAGIRGYLAVLGGSPHAQEPPEIVLVRPLADAAPEGFAAACEAFRRVFYKKSAT